MERHYTPQEVAEVYRCDVQTVYNAIQRKQLRARKIGNRWKIAEHHVITWGVENVEEVMEPSTLKPLQW